VFGVVTGGRVQRELREGEPGPVLGREGRVLARWQRRPRPGEPRPFHGQGVASSPQGRDRHLPLNPPRTQVTG